MTRVYCVLAILLLVGTVSCASREQVYQGMYQGFSSVDETRMTGDPSYDPVRAGDSKKQSYQEYKKEREQILKEDNSLE